MGLVLPSPLGQKASCKDCALLPLLVLAVAVLVEGELFFFCLFQLLADHSTTAKTHNALHAVNRKLKGFPLVPGPSTPAQAHNALDAVSGLA